MSEPTASPVAPAAYLSPAPTLPRLLAPFALDVVLAGISLLLLSIALAVPVIAAYTVMLSSADGGSPDPAAVMAAAMPAIVASSIVAMAMTAALLWLLRGRPLRDPQAPAGAGLSYGLAIGVGLAIQAGGHGLSWLADALSVPVEPSNIAPLMTVVNQWPLLAWLAVVLVAPLSEELLFRHTLLRRFAVAGRGLLGIAVTSLLFGLLHEYAPGDAGLATWLMTLSVYLLMGAGFGGVYVFTRRFGAAFVAHATCNLAAMLLLTFSPA